MAGEIIANLEHAMSSNGNIPEQPRRSARERQMVHKSREEEMLSIPATPKKAKPMRLAQANLDKAAALVVNPNTNSSSAQPSASNRGVVNGGKTSSDRVIAMLVELKEKMVEDRMNANAKFGEMQDSQNALFNEVQQLQNQNEVLRDEITELKAVIHEQFLVPSPQVPVTYAAQASANLVTKSVDMQSSTTPITETPYLTVDISAVEKENIPKVTPEALRTMVKLELAKSPLTQTVNLRAIIRDPQNTKRYRLLFNTEEDRDLARKDVNWAGHVQGVRVLQDQHFPIKIDNANRCSVLTSGGELLNDIKDQLGLENQVTIPHMRWISNIQNGKLYGSMVVWVTKRKDAERLMKEGVLQIRGEAAYTRPFEKRIGPIRCYNCQKYDHQALRFKELDPTCGKYALQGYSYGDCINAIIQF